MLEKPTRMDEEPERSEDGYRATIDGRTFCIYAEALYEAASEELSGKWHAWSFFAYDCEMNVYPADAVPPGVETQETMAGETRDSEAAACAAVEERLRTVARTRSLEGTGFYSPPADRVYPQEFPDLQPRAKEES